MARVFNGSTDKIARGAAVVTAKPCTYSAWFRSTSASAAQMLVSNNNGATSNGINLEVFGGNVGMFTNTGNQEAVSTTAYSANVWNHAAGVYASDDSLIAYLNGGGKATDFGPAATPSGINACNIGVWVTTEPFGGDLAEVAIWSAVLTDQEILALARGLSPFAVRPASLVSYVPIWGLHSPEIDLKTPANTWTVTGATRSSHAPVVPFSRRFWSTAPTVPAAAAGGILYPAALDGMGSRLRALR